MAARKQVLKTEREKLKKSIAAGKLKGVALKKAIGRVYYINGQLKNGQPKRKAGRPRKAHVVNQDQGFLPNFLSQLNTVRIEEMIAEKAFNAIKVQLGLSDKKSRVG